MVDDDAMEQVLQFLHSDNVDEQFAAIQALGEAEHESAVPHLTMFLQDGTDTTLQYTVVVALGRIGDAAPLPELLVTLRTHDMWVRVAVTEALIKIGSPSVPGLIEALTDKNKAVRRAASKALGKIGDKAAGPALEGVLDDPDSGVRRFAAQALERIGTT